MANVRLIAKRAGVSITTVSRVLNNHPRVSPEIRRRVLEMTSKVGYSPAVGRKSITNIAVVYTGESSLGSPFDAAVMYGLAKGMDEHGYDLMVLDARRARQPDETFTQMFIRKGIRGAIIRTTAQTRSLCKIIAAEKFPAVVVGARFDEPEISFVDADSRQSSREAVEHLIALGHRRIAISLNILDDSDHIDRLEGYRKALAEAGIEQDEKLIFRVPAHREGGAQLLRRLMIVPNRPTAIFITDPMTAIGTMGEARKANISVPEQLSVVGFDDTEIRYVTSPELTAVCQDANVLGREAFAALQQLIESRPAMTPIRKSLNTWLVIHNSTAAPPASVS